MEKQNAEKGRKKWKTDKNGKIKNEKKKFQENGNIKNGEKIDIFGGHGGGCGLVVSVVAVYSNDRVWIPRKITDYLYIGLSSRWHYQIL